MPLLWALDYAPGERNAMALIALAIVYALVPSVLKFGAIAALLRFERSRWWLVTVEAVVSAAISRGESRRSSVGN